jgi:hypothetical protein
MARTHALRRFAADPRKWRRSASKMDKMLELTPPISVVHCFSMIDAVFYADTHKLE